MNGYSYSNEQSILGTNNLYYNTLTDGTITMANGDMIGGNLISTKSLIVNGVNISASGSGGSQGPAGIHGTNAIFTTPSIITLEPTAIPYVNDSISSSTDVNGVITNTHNLTFGINKGAKGDKGDSGGTTVGDVLTGLIDVGLAAGQVALGTAISNLYTDVAVLQGEVGTLGSDITLLQEKTMNMSHNPVNNKTNFSVNSLAIDNGVADKITLSNNGSIAASVLNVNTVNAESGSVPEMQITNINPYTVLGGAVGTGINIGASYANVSVNVITIGNPIAIVNLVGLVSCNGRLISDPFHLAEFINQFS